MKKLTYLVVLLALFGLSIPTAAFAQDNDIDLTFDLYVIHGIYGEDLGLPAELPVDVLVNGALCVLEGFTFGEIAGPLTLDADTYNLQVKLADEINPCEGPTVIEADVPFAGGETATIIAHLDTNGAPTASKFVNDVSRVGPWLSRIGVFHAANAPAVDIKANYAKNPNRMFAVNGLENGQGGALKHLAGNWNIGIYPAGQPDPVFGPFEFFMKPFTAQFVYAVGSLDLGSFQLIVQEIDARYNPPAQ